MNNKYWIIYIIIYIYIKKKKTCLKPFPVLVQHSVLAGVTLLSMPCLIEQQEQQKLNETEQNNGCKTNNNRESHDHL